VATEVARPPVETLTLNVRARAGTATELVVEWEKTGCGFQCAAHHRVMTLTTASSGKSKRSRRSRRAAILAHNYQIPAIQDLADVVADSLQMARRASEAGRAPSGHLRRPVMAETAAIAIRIARRHPRSRGRMLPRATIHRRRTGVARRGTPMVSWSRT